MCLPWNVRVRRMCERRFTKLKEDMGNKCSNCGATEKLESHHPYGRHWPKTPRLTASHLRIKRYEKEFLAGELRLLCSHCNKILQPTKEDTPF